MTDEEKAIDYTNNTHIQYNEILSRPEVVDEIRKAYLAGLKTGREIEKEYVKNNAFTSMKEQGLFPFGKWHKIVDGDIPKENKIYLVEIKDNGLAIAYFNGLHWEIRYNLGDSGHCVETVIAWCEPKFEE